MPDPTPPAPRLSADRISAAHARIAPVFRDSPQYESDALSRAVGARTVLKVETANPIRSFKGRGTDNLLATLPAGEALACASAGNFGQGFAWAARARHRQVTVFAATTANAYKVERIRALGAQVILAGEDFDAAKDAARAWAAERGARFVEDGREPAVSEGAGTIALELSRWPAPLDLVLVPLGNGALVNGIGTWLRAHAPGTRVVAVGAAGAPSMARSWEAGRPVATDTMATIADGIGVRVPVPEALDDMRHAVDEVVLVEDAALVEAMRLAHRELGLVLEPAGVAGLAALLAFGGRFRGALVGVPLCGGNLTDQQRREWLGA